MRRGVGTRLLQNAEILAKKNGMRLWLKVNAMNERGIGFYNSHNHQLIGETYFELDGEKYKNNVYIETETKSE